MPLVGLGTWELRGDDGYRAVRRALEVGYRHIDTATMYANEDMVGRAIRDSGVPREQIFVTTKLPPGHTGRERHVIEESLRALGMDYVDLWLVHWPPADDESVASWREFVAVRDAGLARAIGVSNYTLEQIDVLTAATGVTPVVNQVPWSPADHDPQILADHRERSVVLEGYSPLKRTRLTHPAVTAAAEHHRVTTAQVVLRWHVEHGIPVIPKSADPARIEQNFDVWSFSLADDEVAALDAMGVG